MEIKIKFSNLLAKEIGETKILSSPNVNYLTVTDLLDLIKKESWSQNIIENDHLKTSVVLIIDDEIIQFSNPPALKITGDSKISFHLMFAGGL